MNKNKVINTVFGAVEDAQSKTSLSRTGDGWHPLSAIQRSLWFLYQMEPELRGYYNIVFVARARPSIDPFALQRALDCLTERHSMLRTCFAQQGGEPMQRMESGISVPLEVIDVDDLDDATVVARIEADRVRPFDLSRAPLIRAGLYRASPQECFALLALDHLVSDAWSLWQLLAELDELLRTETPGEVVLAKEDPAQFFDHVEQQRQWLESARGTKQFEYWRDVLHEPCPPLDLLPDRISEQAIVREGRETIRFFLSSELTARVRVLSDRQGVSVFATLLTAYFVLLYRLTGQHRLAVGSPMPARGKEWGDTIGTFMNPVVLCADVEPEMSVVELLKEVSSTVWQALKNQNYPLAELVERLNPQRAQFGQPYFQVAFTFQKARMASGMVGLMVHQEGASPVPWGGSELSAFGHIQNGGGVGLDLSFDLAELDDGGICAPVDYNTGKFERNTIERYLGYWQEVLKGMVANEAQLVARLPMLPEAEREQVMEKWNATVCEYPQDKCLNELFEAQVERSPEAVAVAQGEVRLSYGELNGRANRLAHHLRAVGVKPDNRVAVCLERSPELVVALLAVLKAGGAYVPLDPGYPGERLSYMLADSAPVAVLGHGATHEVMARQLDGGVALIDLERDAHAWSNQREENPSAADTGLNARHLAYVIYTSGSTGLPKGVMNEHRGLSNLVSAQVALFHVDATSRVLQFASPSFDASVFEIVMAIGTGACLCLAGREELMPGRPLLTTLQQMRVTHATLPLSALPFCEIEDLAFAATTLIVAGEAIAPKEANRWSARLKLINAYGPTETTVCATTHAYTAAPGASLVPIGRPIANTRIYILDTQLQPVPVGVVGELFIGGVPVGRGYLNRPELTAERFAEDPYSEEAEARMYKTGDLGRWLANGEIEFLGRNDFQIKIRGFRIELGEIEAKLGQGEGVQEVVVVAREDEAGEKRLVAYYVGEAEVEALRTQAVSGLPPYMVPAAYVQLEQLPLTPNRKLDRKALPAPEGDAFASRGYEAPQGDVEEALVRIWAELLKVERVGRQDNFFELGGHSLLGVQLVSRVQQTIGIELSLHKLFANPILCDLADCIQAPQSDAPVVSCLTPIRESGRSAPLFAIHPQGGDVKYAIEMARWIDAEVPIYGLAASGLQVGEIPLRTVPAMAARYICAMRSVQPRGPYRLAGYSAGGLVAYEIAHQLCELKETVEFLGLIDTSYDTTMLRNELRKWLREGDGNIEELERAMLLLTLEDLLGLSSERLQELALLGTIDEILRVVVVEQTGRGGQMEIEMYKRINAVRSAFAEALQSYAPPANAVAVQLIAALESKRDDFTLGLGSFLGERLCILPIEGDHQSIIQEPCIAKLGELLSRELHKPSTVVFPPEMNPGRDRGGDRGDLGGASRTGARGPA